MLRAMIRLWLLFVMLWLALPSGASVTQVLFNGRNAGDWDTRRDSSRLASEFILSEVAHDRANNSLRWRFVSRGVAFNDLFLMKPITRPFAAIRVRVRCDGAPFTLGAKVADADHAEWTADRVHLSPKEGWRWVEFPMPAWQAASWSRDADGRMDFPLAYFTLIAFDVQPAVEYNLKIARVEVVRPDPPTLRLQRFSLPGILRHGRTYRASLRFTLDRPPTLDGAWLVFRRGGQESFRVPLALPTPPTRLKPGQVIAVNAAVPVPEYTPGGRHAVALEVGEAQTVRQRRRSETVAMTDIEARKPGRTQAAVRSHHGVPTLFINGKPHNGMAYTAYGPSVEVFTDFARAGVDLFSFSATPTESGYGLSQTAWTAPGKYDFSELDRRVQMVLQANPRAFFFPRLYLHAPKWWSEQHPDDVVRVDPGDGKPVPFIHAGGKPAPSWASEAWRRDTVEGLRRLIAHVEAQPWADRCIGYHIASGTTEEWMMWGGNEDEWVDYSPANLAGFRHWLREKYGMVEKLRQAWNDSAASFETAAIPTKAQRQRTDFGSLRDPAKEQAVIDFYLYNSDLVADTIRYFARAVKDLTRREKTVGVFYGYLLQLCGEQRQQNAGHLALGRVLESPDVDFLCSPTSYAFRQVGGEGTSHFMSLLGSVRLHDKLWFDENDIRTSLTGGTVGEWGRPADVAGDVLQQDKELANVLVNGAAQWWFDVGGNRYNDPALMKRIGELTANARETQARDRTPADEVALVVDERSLCYLRVADPLGAWLLVSQLPALSRIGAPVGHYLVTDLPKITDRKVFLFPTSFAPTAADRAAVESLKGGGRVLVFFTAPGLYREGQIDERAMERLTGIRLRLSTEPTPLKVTLQAGSPLTEGLTGQTVGVEHRASPVALPDDPQAKVIGTLPDGRPALVVKQYPGWTAVYSAVPMLPASLLRRIAQMGGVHAYLDTEDVVWASREMLAVSVKEAGPRAIRLPRGGRVRELYTGQAFDTTDGTFTADFPARATRLFIIPPSSSASGLAHQEEARKTGQEAGKRLEADRTLRLAPGPGNPRNSEGDFIRLKDGRMLFVYTHFTGGGGDDHGRAHLAARVSRDGGRTWSAEDTIVVPNEGGFNVMSVSLRRMPGGEIGLFYLRKNSLADCRPVLRRSRNEGGTWGAPEEIITDEVGYYVMNNDRVLLTGRGRLVVPVALHKGPDGMYPAPGRALCYLSDDGARTWRRSRSVLELTQHPGNGAGLQEPGVVELKDGRLMMFCRTDRGCQYLSYSSDGGDTWSAVVPSGIRSPLSPATIERIPATGDLLLVWNDHYDPKAGWSAGARTPLTVALSRDDGRTWVEKQMLEDDPEGWYCYTALTFVEDRALLAYCAGKQRESELNATQVTTFPVDRLYHAAR